MEGCREATARGKGQKGRYRRDSRNTLCSPYSQETSETGMVEIIIYIFIGKRNLNSEWFYDLIRIFLLLRATAKPQSQFFWLLLYRFFPLPRWCLWVWLSPSRFTVPGWWTEFVLGIWAQAEVQVPNSLCTFHLLLLQFNKAPPTPAQWAAYIEIMIHPRDKGQWVKLLSEDKILVHTADMASWLTFVSW